MNVVKLISEGITKQYGASVAPCCAAAFDFGVSHALAAMFPVVTRMDQLVEEEWYHIQNVYDGSWEVGKWTRTWTNSLTFMLPESSCLPFERCKQIRRCPTPGDVGMGGEA